MWSDESRHVSAEADSRRPADSSRVDVSILVVSWNVRDLLVAGLSSLQTHAQGYTYQVVVVDNASRDGSADAVAECHPQAILIRNSANLGFARACNIGIPYCTGRHIVFHGPDTRLIEDAYGAMMQYLDGHPDIGVLGCRLVNPDGTPQRSVREFPSLVGQFARSFHLGSILPAKWRGKPDRSGETSHPGDVDWLVGTALMMPSSLLREFGGMNEEYPIYTEDLDLCLRMRRAGKRVVFFPAVRVVHYGNRSGVQAFGHERKLHVYRSYFRFLDHWFGYWHAFIMKLIVSAGALLEVVAFGLTYVLTHVRRRRTQASEGAQVIRALLSYRSPGCAELPRQPRFAAEDGDTTATVRP
jgi:hypothetical protein